LAPITEGLTIFFAVLLDVLAVVEKLLGIHLLRCVEAPEFTPAKEIHKPIAPGFYRVLGVVSLKEALAILFYGGGEKGGIHGGLESFQWAVKGLLREEGVFVWWCWLLRVMFTGLMKVFLFLAAAAKESCS